MYFYSVIIPSLFPITFITAFIMNLFKDDFSRYKYGNIIMIFLFSQIGGYIIGVFSTETNENEWRLIV